MKRTKKSNHVHREQINVKILYAGETEHIFFQHLKEIGCFHDRDNLVNNSVIKITPEKQSVPQNFIKLISSAQKKLKNQEAQKIYIVCDTDYIIQDSLIQECTKVNQILKNLKETSGTSKIILIPLHPCLEIVFAFHWLQRNNNSKNFLEKQHSRRSIQELVINYLNENLLAYYNKQKDCDNYQYSRIKADKAYFEKYLFPIFTTNISNLLSNLNNKKEENWCSKLDIEQLKSKTSGVANLCFIEELDCQKLIEFSK